MTVRRLRLGVLAGVAACALVLPLTSPARPTSSPTASTRILETVTVPNQPGQVVTTSTKLDEDHRYRITASGTVSDWCPPTATKPEECSFGSPLEIAQGVDALYCYAKWRCPTPQLWRQLRFNGVGLDLLAKKEIPYSASHSYTVEIEDLSGPLTLHSADGGSDNSGAFTVSIADLGPQKKPVGCAPGRSQGGVRCIHMKNKRYVPFETTAEAGDTIKLCNVGPFFHKPFSLAKNNRFQSPNVRPGHCRVVKIHQNPSKRIALFCELHSLMKGVVHVRPKR